MKIEEGKFYKTRDGLKVKIIEDAKDRQPFRGDDDWWRFQDGKTWEHMDSGNDLVSEWDAAEKVDVGIENAELSAMLNERGERYGKFVTHAHASQNIKTAMRNLAGWQKLDNDHCEALEMIAHKIARILNGDPNYADSWVDIAGYAKLVADRLNGVER